MKRSLLTLGVLAGVFLFLTPGLSAAPFYQGKTLRVTVGHSAGGGFDLWARLVARHIGKHIPGRPDVIVDNITGAGGLIHVTQLFGSTKPDGLTVGHFNGAFLLSALFGQPGYTFDGQKFIYLGAVHKENPVYIMSKKSGITSAEKWRARALPATVGGFVPGNSLDNCHNVMKEVLGFPVKDVMGYKGTADILIAMDSGELAGGAIAWDTIKANRTRQIEAGDNVIVLQCTRKPLKDLSKVPRMIDQAQSREQQNLVELAVNMPNEFSKPWVVTPGTPRERVDILRKALQELGQDKEFLAEVDKMKFTFDPMTGDELTTAVTNALMVDATTKAKLKEILFKEEGK